MCGIAGVVPLNGGAPADGARLAAMAMRDAIAHRGPDDEGFHLDERHRPRRTAG